MKNIIYLIFGLIIGSSITYFVICRAESTSMVGVDYNGDGHIEPTELPVGHPNSPFSEQNDSAVNDSEGEKYIGNMNDLGDRDISLAVWYGNQAKVVIELEAYTGHKFKPVWNRRTPIEILEEQLVFMRGFIAESERLAQEQIKQE